MFSLLPLVAPHLRAGAWPQDNLNRLKDLASIPVDKRNSDVVSRDYYGVTGSSGFIAPGTTVTRTVNVGQDGDFWLNSMSFWAMPTTGGQFDVPVPWGTIQIVDNSSGYSLFSPNVRLSFLSGVIPLQSDPLAANTTANRMLQRPYIRTTLPQPYPLLRDSSFTITMRIDTTGAVNNNNIFFILDGWKEYQYAA